MNFKNQQSSEKLRGAYYTPMPIAVELSRWALDGGASRVLEPSCGDGVFFEAIHRVLIATGSRMQLSVDAVEITPSEAEKSRQAGEKLLDFGSEVRVIQTDFLSWIANQPKSRLWDAIIGNPPYIRYQYFEAEQQRLAEKIFASAGVPFTMRTNAWVPFVIASVTRLAPGGRLAMVLPAEILHIIHADGLRRLLEQEMETINVLDIREMVFDRVLQGVVLIRAVKRKDREFRPLTRSLLPLLQTTPSTTHKTTLAVDKDNTAELRICPVTSNGGWDLARSLEECNRQTIDGHCDVRSGLDGKWTRALLEEKELDLLLSIESQHWATPFRSLAEVDIGIVTGANKFFVVDVETARRYELADYTSPMLARSELMQGIVYTCVDQNRNEAEGKAVRFVEFPNEDKSRMTPGMREYLELGEKQALHKRYKCRIREPWYLVPYVWVSKVSLLKRCHNFPRLVFNDVGAYSTDTAYRVVMKNDYKGRERDFVFSFLNSLTFLFAELEGRHYAGGVLELVPSEIEQLLVPLFRPTPEQFHKVDQMVRARVSVDELLDFTDPLILGLGTSANLSTNQISDIREAGRRLRHRRQRSTDPL